MLLLPPILRVGLRPFSSALTLQELVSQLSCRGRPIVDILCQASHDDRFQIRGDIRAILGWRFGPLGDLGKHNLHRSLANERRSTGEQEVSDGTQRVDIASRVKFVR